MALGGDQAGSIRIPACRSGIVGLKPTFGLVPYTGAVMIEMTIDTLGPMCDTVENTARLLSVIAGPDPLDPRQRGVPPVRRPRGRGGPPVRKRAFSPGQLLLE